MNKFDWEKIKYIDDILNDTVEEPEIELRKVIESGYPVDQEGPYGTTMLVAAVDTDNLKLVSVLIDLDADINKRITSISPISKKVYRKEITALMCVHSVVMAKRLIKAGANPKLKDSSGFTALDHAKQLFAEDPDKGIGFELEIENIIEYLSSVT